MSSSAIHPIKEIDDALSLELAATPKQFVYIVAEVRQVADVTVVKVNLDDSDAKGLDDSLEGAAAWWPADPRGSADVLSVDPERECVNLRFVSPAPPKIGDKLFLYPPIYLEKLRDWWRIPQNAEAGLAWLHQANNQNRHDPTFTLSTTHFGWLRKAQRAALQLPAWSCAFLEGPPGTGKTTTVGVLLATYLARFPQKRVLLLSTTNNAVDLALVAVDKALERLPDSWLTRQKCKRLGNHFHASHYRDRNHLLPAADPKLIKALAALESQRPDPQDVVAYAAWKKQVELIRSQIKADLEKVLRESQLTALTTCGAMFWAGALNQVAPFDLIVFDEASQVGAAYALALATFGRACIFAGDPAQLAPVVRSEHRQPRRWLGRSAFDVVTIPDDQNPRPSVFLDEQSRMHDHICDVVSRVFYGGKLRVAADAQNDPKWRQAREVSHRRLDLRRHVGVVQVPASSTYSQKYRGPIRFDSAKAVQELVADLVLSDAPDSILVLTPFRAQRTLLRMMLRNDFRGVSVSTVHRAQGSESRTIIFDPVDGMSEFLQGEAARRLVNVALSRAEARLILMLSEADRQNLLFQHPQFITIRTATSGTAQPVSPPNRMATQNGARSVPAAEPMVNLVRRRDFPRCAHGMRVLHKNAYGEEIRGIASVTSNQITIRTDNGEEHTYSADFLRAMCGKR